MGTPPDLRQKNQKKKQKCRLFCCLWLLLQLLLLIIIKKLIHCIIKSISLRKIRHTTLELMMMILINQMKRVACLESCQQRCANDPKQNRKSSQRMRLLATQRQRTLFARCHRLHFGAIDPYWRVETSHELEIGTL